MEILSTTEHVWEFWFSIIFAGFLILFLLFMMSLFCYYMIKEKEYNAGTIAPTLIFTVLFFIFSPLFVLLVNDGIPVSHKVEVTDWNEIYKRGYEVEKQEGNIATIRLK